MPLSPADSNHQITSLRLNGYYLFMSKNTATEKISINWNNTIVIRQLYWISSRSLI